MTPPGGSNGDGRSGPPLDPSNIIPFPQPGSAAAEDFRNGTGRTGSSESGSPEARPSETTPSRTRSSLPPDASSFLNFPDFSVLSSLVQGHTPSASGHYARVHTAIRLLANPNLNGTYDATFSREGHTIASDKAPLVSPSIFIYFRKQLPAAPKQAHDGLSIY